MVRGRRRIRNGNEATSTFEKTPEFVVAVLDLQKKYVQTDRSKPAMRDLLMEGISLLLEREGLPGMTQPMKTEFSPILEMPKKSGA